MDMDFDVTQVFQDRIAAGFGLNLYDYIMTQVQQTDVANDSDFQRTFNGFYRVRRNAEWRKIYYTYFESIKTSAPTFAGIITYLYEQTGNIEPSFSSKMLATIDPQKPIWDKYVVQNLGIQLRGNSKQEQLENAIDCYARIEKWYEDFLHTPKANECIALFDRLIPCYSHISDVKKIDCVVWSIR